MLLCIIEALNDPNILIVESVLSNIQEIRFHHHHQARLIHYFGQDQTHMIQCTIWVRPGCYKPDQTCLTRIKRNTDDTTWFQPCYVIDSIYSVSGIGYSLMLVEPSMSRPQSHTNCGNTKSFHN